MATDHDNNNQLQVVEALERAVAEIEVLESIYGSTSDDNDNDDDESAFRVVSMDALESARTILVEADCTTKPVPRLDIELQLQLNTAEDSKGTDTTTGMGLLRCGMPPGYPISRAAIVSVEVPNLTRSVQEQLSKDLKDYAEQLLGEEAILGLAQKLQEIGADALEEAAVAATTKEEKTVSSSGMSLPQKFSRQWLFMDHIKAESRRAQMIREAASLNVGGLIKPGYPGVCVIEGDLPQVEQFVMWMKQIWIGRVAIRGEVTVTMTEGQTHSSLSKLPKDLTDLGDGKNLPNMGVLGSACREAGLEEEFLEYIMQIRSSSSSSS